MAISLGSTDPTTTYTLKQFVALKESDKMTYPNYSIMERSLTNPKLVYSINNLIYDYMTEINQLRKTVKVSIEEKIKYQYRPKLLSYDIYGTTELYFMILAMNGMCNLKEFELMDLQFYALTPVDLSNMLNEIYNAETNHININRTNLEIYNS